LLSSELIVVVLGVLSDWRVIAAAVFFLLASALLRYVGLVLSRERRRKVPALRGPKAEGGASKPVAKPAKEILDEAEGDDEMVV
jgi:hypothetical protein